MASDNNYVKPMATVMASVLCNSDSVVCFHIFDGGISEENKAKLEELKKIKDCTINFITVDKEIFAKFPHHWSSSNSCLPYHNSDILSVFGFFIN
jgi:lipopolysaccharide biosynthesis glycosyltransferase